MSTLEATQGLHDSFEIDKSRDGNLEDCLWPGPLSSAAGRDWA